MYDVCIWYIPDTHEFWPTHVPMQFKTKHIGSKYNDGMMMEVS